MEGVLAIVFIFVGSSLIGLSLTPLVRAMADRIRHGAVPRPAEADPAVYEELDHLRQERMRWTTFGDCVGAHRAQLQDFRRVEFELDVPPDRVSLRRRIERFP